MCGTHSVLLCMGFKTSLFHQSIALQTFSSSCITTTNNLWNYKIILPVPLLLPLFDQLIFIKLQISDKQRMEEVRKQRQILHAELGYIIHLKLV